MSAEAIAKEIQLGAASLPRSAGTSQQPEEEANFWTPDDAIAPPEDLERLANLTQVSRLRRSCIAAMVQNTVGLGVEIVPQPGREDEASEDEPHEVLDKLDELARRDRRSQRPSFARLLRRVWWDRNEVGNGALEVSRNAVTGEIDGLFHAPGKRVRRLTQRNGWVIGTRSGTERTRFYDFGEKVRYENGKPTGRLAGSASDGFRRDRNELLVVQLYTSESLDYGLPPDAQLAIDYLGDKLAGETNVAFFDSLGVPPTVIAVTVDPSQIEAMPGEQIKLEVPPDVIQKIGDVMRGTRDKSRRVAIVAVPGGSRMEVHELAVRSERDVGFVEYRRDNRHAMLGAWRLSPIFVADIEDANYSTAEVERAITKEQVFDPEQAEATELLQPILDDLGFPHLQLRFRELAIESDAAKRESANDAADRGMITNEEYRDALHLARLPEATDGGEPKDGEMPAGWGKHLVVINRSAPAGEIQRGVESAAQLLAEAQAAGAIGIEAGVGANGAG